MSASCGVRRPPVVVANAYMCDDCKVLIVRARYHCRTCLDVDVCLACYRESKYGSHVFDRYRVDGTQNSTFATEFEKPNTEIRMLGRPGAPRVDKTVLGSL